MSSILFLVAYLLGSLNFAIIFSKIFQLPDPRTAGSNNPGATNALRLYGRGKAFLILVLDILKGLVAVFIAYIFTHNIAILGYVSLFAVIGHIFPIYHHFKGGKGVATAFGCLLALVPFLALFIFGTWVFVLLSSRMVSLASISAAFMTPIYLYFLTSNQAALVLPFSLTAFLVIISHISNIKRLIVKGEDKI